MRTGNTNPAVDVTEPHLTYASGHSLLSSPWNMICKVVFWTAGEEAVDRIAALTTDDERVKAATHVIDNDGSLADLKEKVHALIDDLKLGTPGPFLALASFICLCWIAVHVGLG
jgi:hypothetical protein